MKILFLDQSGKLGGAELCLADITQHFRQTSLVGVFSKGPFPDYLRQLNIPVKILADQTLNVQKASGLLAVFKSLNRLIPLITAVTQLSKGFDLVYANTQKALVVGAIASFVNGRPLVYHLHDIVSPDHFSSTNRRIIITLANRAALIIANSQASRDAFIAAGGRADTIQIVYNGFRLESYQISAPQQSVICNSFVLNDKFVIGHFSRLAPWKGQHILIKALAHCSEKAVALIVGDALFGEDDYATYLHCLVKNLNLQHRVHFLGFRSDVPALMKACDLIAHTSTAPEPFGRVIVEAMLCNRPVVAAGAGGAVELIEQGRTGWLTPPSDVPKLADIITTVYTQPEIARAIAQKGYLQAQQRFNLANTNEKIETLLYQIRS
ncbi:glycosyltransferase [Romeria aff. gracilis LEGE 07310]|uniref:Glycosyltransferase n=1 Tax=Vasconcelosia minhoensis LEGE 07310 TaxID=915328 RepID=A0A8J7AJ42_9CYAN|nr:glycosyltransferase [Romeria gracilis]MBE9076335.1 glycosyltransferase [Romeria aff. gracilis LEGE 07310]